jgi:hypothetical protein
MKQKIVLGVALCLLGTAAGCNPEIDTVDLDSDDEADLGEFAGMDPETTFFTRTQVTLLPDGTPEVLTEQVSLAQQIAEREAEESGITLEEFYTVEHPHKAALTKTPASCISTGYLRLWTSVNYTGNQICFSGTGSTNLNSYTTSTGCVFGYHPLFCNLPIKSLKPGSYGASLTPALNTCYNADTTTTSNPQNNSQATNLATAYLVQRPCPVP